MFRSLQMLSNRTWVLTLTFLLLAAVVSSSCGFTLDELATTSTDVYAEADTEGEFCNCHLKAEIDHLVVAPAILTPSFELMEIVLPFTLAAAVGVTDDVPRVFESPPEIVLSVSPHSAWPVRLARAHL